MKKQIRFSVWLAAIMVGTAFSIFAQSINSNLSSATSNAQAGAYYFVARSNEMTMQVNIWGFVQHPGRYEVSMNVDLIQLLSFAGGPTNDADMDDVRISRIVKRDGVVSMKDIRINMKNLDKIQESKLLLEPGDTIFIDHTSWLTMRDVVSVVTTAAIVTAAVAQMLNYSK
ncbi:MAG: SLBB domain-containing protein [bacterium]